MIWVYLLANLTVVVVYVAIAVLASWSTLLPRRSLVTAVAFLMLCGYVHLHLLVHAVNRDPITVADMDDPFHVAMHVAQAAFAVLGGVELSRVLRRLDQLRQ